MNRDDFRQHVPLGRTGLDVSRIGLAGGYNVPAEAVERAFCEYGVNYFYWCLRRTGMRAGLRALTPKNRSEIVIAIQSYDRLGLWINSSVQRALKTLRVDYIDILFLGWFDHMPGNRVLDAAQELVANGQVRFLGLSGHNRLFHGQLARRTDSPFDVQMIRYNAAHRGAESDVFEGLTEPRSGLTTYTATRWGNLLNSKKMPPGEEPLTAADCYRFALSHPEVDLCLAGPRNQRELDEGLSALDAGPLTTEEMARVRRIGDHLHNS
jgi:aryl-alcohol dehydrogenase-like predicted oxidoreductase